MSDILEKPVLALVTAALDTVAGNYAYDDVFRYLKTGLTDLPQEDRDLLENYVLEWDIRGSAWTQDKPWGLASQGLWFPLGGGGPHSGGPVGRRPADCGQASGDAASQRQ